ncbi:hypothetical protein GQX73_g4312 [Xylaria multiplex]|uniref:2EXR domain-containing protein n=1 Tax=Xylaria multiplex TaxID=323545 RepID=A0A7C8N8I1_9PEZI|nr:hypothetical protein GQX73_g4312 [Xylaria multiplex]
MATFHYYPELPTELRLEIWRAYFAGCRPQQVHVFAFDPTKNSISYKIVGGIEYNILEETEICAESWAMAREIFGECFTVGDMRDLLPYYPSAQILGTVRFAILNKKDGIVISCFGEGTIKPFTRALESMSWFPRK